MRLVLLFLMIPFLGFSQFYLNGAASKLSGSCYLLTPATLFTGGSIWSPNKINLNESFQAIFKLSLGCTDAGGADGIVFGFQPISTSFGQAGGGLGFQTIAPSLGVEFDTWQNNDFGDPWYDHIAIVRDGDLNHNSSFSNLAGPVQADPNDPNIEDCDFHRVRVDWDAGQQLLQVWFDCELRLSYTGDIVMEIFDGDPWVYWGFTAGTGSAFNVQQVCLDYTTFFQQQPDVHICAGGRCNWRLAGVPLTCGRRQKDSAIPTYPIRSQLLRRQRLTSWRCAMTASFPFTIRPPSSCTKIRWWWNWALTRPFARERPLCSMPLR
ncbi:MAG: hypothetical protein IPJ40_16770 [Saprospirales bacterium]|nr:hypothetical protein [Saprospirales bacterium]